MKIWLICGPSWKIDARQTGKKRAAKRKPFARFPSLFHSSSRVDLCVCAGIERAAQSDIAASPGANHALTHLICECVCAQMCWKIVRVPSLSAADAESISLSCSLLYIFSGSQCVFSVACGRACACVNAYMRECVGVGG